MTPLVPAMMFGWPVVALGLFALLPSRRAAIITLIGGWLLLPMHAYTFSGLPEYDRAMVVVASVLLGTIVFDSGRLLQLRLRWWDLPILAFCICPLASSLSNQLGAYDGLSNSFSRAVSWALPYLIGRIYFGDLDSLGELAIGVVVGGLVYLPLCLFEVRMSPQLHRTIYGFHQHSFIQHMRYGGFRPMVFMQHGLAVAWWMMAASVTCFALWRSHGGRRFFAGQCGLCLAALLGTTVLCKSIYALLLLAVGLGAVFILRRLPWVAVLLLAAAPGYAALRLTGAVSSESVLNTARLLRMEGRIGSLQARMTQEELFGARAWQRKWLGWGGWGRSFPINDTGVRATRGVDGLWTIILGNNGLVGLGLLFLSVLLPVAIAWRRFPPGTWQDPRIAGAAGLSLMVVLWMLDCLMNAMLNPVCIVAAGALGGIAIAASARPLADSARGFPVAVSVAPRAKSVRA